MSLQNADQESVMYGHLDVAMTAETRSQAEREASCFSAAAMHDRIAQENYSKAYALDAQLRATRH